MPSSSSKSSMSSFSLTSSSCKCNLHVVVIVLSAVIIIMALYYMTRTKPEPFYSSNASGGSPNLTPASGECVVALFYADWCPHCVKFKPDYKRAMSELNNKVNKKGKKLRLEMVDCDANKTIAKKYSVSGFPTVKLINDDGVQSEYSGERTFIGLQQYLLSDNDN